MSNNEIITKNELSQLLIENINSEYTFNQLILNGADVNYQNTNGWTALFEIIIGNENEKLKELINLGVNIHQRDKETRNALFWAIYSLNDKAFEILLDENIDLNVYLKDKLHAFHYSIYKGKIEYVKKFLELGVDINFSDHLEANGLFYAVLYKHYDLAKFLLRENANIYQEDIFGNSAYKQAKEYGIDLHEL